MPDVAGEHLDSDVLACIEVCIDCHKACTQTTIYCLQQGGEHAEANHVRLMLDCAEICQTSANFMLRGSDLHAYTCHVCALVCRQCGEDCERMSDDLRMAACAEECHRCADSCERMAAQHDAGFRAGRKAEKRGPIVRSKEAQPWRTEQSATTPSSDSMGKKLRSSSKRGSSRSS